MSRKDPRTREKEEADWGTTTQGKLHTALGLPD